MSLIPWKDDDDDIVEGEWRELNRNPERPPRFTGPMIGDGIIGPLSIIIIILFIVSTLIAILL